MSNLADQDYSIRLTDFLNAISHARDFPAAQHIIEQCWEVSLDTRFLPGLVEHFRGTGDVSTDQMAMMMVQMALVSTLSQMSPQHLGALGLVVILALGDQKLAEFAEQYGDWLDGRFFAQIKSLTTLLEQYHANDLADFFLHRLQNANNGLRYWCAMDLVKPLVDNLLCAEPQEFMELAVRQGRHTEAWASDGLTTVLTNFFDRHTLGDFYMAFCVWSLQRAIDMLSDLKLEEDATLADALRLLAITQTNEWTNQFVKANDFDAMQAWNRIDVWLAWGNHPPRPHPTLQKLARVRTENDLRKLVDEEPWLLSQPAIDSICNGGIFVVIPELFGKGDLLSHIGGWLKRWQSDLTREDKNPIIRLARQVEGGQLKFKDAHDKIRVLGRLNILQFAAIDEYVQNALHVGSEYVMILADLNYEAASKSGNRLMQGYAALSRGYIRQERAPYDEIKPYLEEAIEIARQLDHPLLLAHALDAMGQVHISLGEINQAFERFAESQNAIRRLPPGYGRPETLLHLASLHLEKDNLEISERYLKLVAQYHTQDEISENAGRYWFLWGGLLWQKKDRDGARQAWSRAEMIGLQLGNRGILQEVQYHRAMMALEQGDPDLAKELLAQVSATTPAGGQFRLLKGLAMLDWQRGKYEQFIAHAKQAVTEAQRMDNPVQELAMRIRLMMIYGELQWQEETQAEEARCVALASQIGDQTVDVIILLNRGASLSQQGKLRAALISYRAALRKAHQRKQYRFVSTLLQNIGAVYLDLDKLDLANLMFGIARAMEGPGITARAETGIQLNQAAVWARQAQNLLSKNQTMLAHTLFARAEQAWHVIAERADFTLSDRLSALNSLASVYADLGNATQRAGAFRSAVKLLDQQRIEFSSPIIQKRFLRERAGLYGTAIEASVQAGQVAEAVEIAEKMRARTLGSRLLQLTALPDKFRDEYRRLVANLEQTQDCWLSEDIIRGDWMGQRWAIAQSDIESIRDDLQSTQQSAEQAHRDLEDLVQRVQKENPDFTLLPMSTPLTFANIQSTLANQPETAIVYFQARPIGTIACIVTAKQCESLILPLTLRQLVDILSISRMSAPRAEGFLSRFKAIESLFRSASFASTVDFVANQLTKWLWADLHPKLQALGVRDLVLIPDGFLALLPLHIAPLIAHDQSAIPPLSKDWLLDHYTVSYAPSVQIWDLCRSRAKTRARLGWSALLAGTSGNAPLSAAIPAALTKIFGEGETIWNVKTDSPNGADSRSILHIHAHGRFDADLPEATALHLGGQEKITLAEISRAFSVEYTRLVVLSACESGEVAVERVPEFVGLPSAFLLSGAAAVIAAMWRVDEAATFLLFARFYQHIAKDMRTVEALNQAQRWLRDLGMQEIAHELEIWRSIVSKSVGISPIEEIAKTRITLLGAVERLQEQDRLLARLISMVDGVDHESASELLLEEMRSHPVDSDPLEKDLYEIVNNLWTEMQAGEWKTPRLLARLRELRDCPFGSPFYWGSFQIVGATE